MAVAGPAEGAAGGPRDRELREALEDIVAAGAVSAQAEVVEGGRPWRAAAGVADVRTERPAPVGGLARVGSVSKTFTAVVALQLVAEGRLRLDDAVERFVPGLVPGGEDITVRQLLTHTSGLFDYAEDQQAVPLSGQQFLDRTRFRTFTPRELVGIAVGHEPYFPPGQGFRYSNTGYVLIGLIIEKVTGRWYGEEIEHRIIAPLGLRDTSVPFTRPFLPGRHARGYMRLTRDGAAELVDVTEMNPSWASAAGAVISTPADLDRFFAALLGGRLLRPAELEVMRTAAATDPQGVAYGMGLWSQPRSCGVRIWGHGGRIPGYKTTSVHSGDGTRQFTVSYVPSSANGAPEALASQAMIDEVFCGRP
ncbi:serine hydrolase domain-containing protein [Actinomadura sp. 3N407]|uniref:serine hydrolase domain-containing protein n=1 Tax=Actinomadura sp. 3N407 TaxID=3457423 RepID=UPI003FCD1B30